jgi:TRAP-type mannitol/chloroaromatic compound transport system permease small subunit
MNLLLRVAAFIDTVNDWIGRVVSWLTLAMVLIGSANAVFRYMGRFTGFDLSSNAYLESQWYLFSLVFLLAASYTLRSDRHVRVDVLYGRLTEKRKAWLNLAGGVLFLTPFCILMIWVSWPWVANSWAVLEMSPDPGGLLQGFSEIVKSAATIRGLPALGSSDPAPQSGQTHGG